MAIKSPKAKGSSGEYEIINLLTAWAAEAGVALKLTRNLEQTRSGGADVNGVPGLEVEVKRQEVLSVPAWWRQVCKAADSTGNAPLLVYRQNRKPWRFKVRQYVVVGQHNGSVLTEFEMDAVAAKQWFQYHCYYHQLNEEKQSAQG